MPNTSDDLWWSVSFVKQELIARSTLSPADVDDLLKAAVKRDHVSIRFDDTGEEARWSQVKDSRYNESATLRQLQERSIPGSRHNPFNRSRDVVPRADVQSGPVQIAYDRFVHDPIVRLNLCKVMAFIGAHHGAKFDPQIPDPNALNLDAPAPIMPGRREAEFWEGVQDDFLLWLDRSEVPAQTRLVEWVQNWFLDRGYEHPQIANRHSNRVKPRKMPAESTIKLKVNEVLERYKSLTRNSMISACPGEAA